MPKKVFVVDDEKDLLPLIEGIFRIHHLDCVLFTNGEDCLRAIEKEICSAFVSDINLPGGMNGYTLYESIRKKKQFKQFPYILMTGDILDPGHLKKLTDADPFLKVFLKPFSINDIAQHLSRSLKESSSLHQ